MGQKRRIKKVEKVRPFEGEDAFIVGGHKLPHLQATDELYLEIAGTGGGGVIDNTGGGGTGGDVPTVADYQYKDMSMIDCTNVVSELSSAQGYLSTNQSKLTNTQLSRVSSYIATLNAYNTKYCPTKINTTYVYPIWDSLDCQTLAAEILKLQNYMDTISDPNVMHIAGIQLSNATSLQKTKCGTPPPIVYDYPDWNTLDCPTIQKEIARLQSYMSTITNNATETQKANDNLATANSLYQTKCVVPPKPPTYPDWNSLDCPTLAAEITHWEQLIASNAIDSIYMDEAKSQVAGAKTLKATKCDVKTTISSTTTVVPLYGGSRGFGMPLGGGGGGGEEETAVTTEETKNYSWLWLLAAATGIYLIFRKK